MEHLNKGTSDFSEDVDVNATHALQRKIKKESKEPHAAQRMCIYTMAKEQQ